MLSESADECLLKRGEAGGRSDEGAMSDSSISAERKKNQNVMNEKKSKKRKGKYQSRQHAAECSGSWAWGKAWGSLGCGDESCSEALSPSQATVRAREQQARQYERVRQQVAMEEAVVALVEQAALWSQEEPRSSLKHGRSAGPYEQACGPVGLALHCLVWLRREEPRWEAVV
jgi:hypothetical protein